jgi:hypothetical protein
MPPHVNQFKQRYEVRGGYIEVRIQTEHALGGTELQAFGRVVEACEAYRNASPPEGPVARAERLDDDAIAKEWRS